MLPDRFWSKVNKRGLRAGRLGRCWVWTGNRQHGYGTFWIDGQDRRAHRVAWGDVPEGMDVLHHCDNPPCVRRSHLFLGTQADNLRDMTAKGRHGMSRKTHCPARHPYDAANTLVYHGRRNCRTCRNARMREARRRAA